jgi:hypothetical protein
MVYASDNNWFSGMTNKTTPDIDSTLVGHFKMEITTILKDKGGSWYKTFKRCQKESSSYQVGHVHL